MSAGGDAPGGSGPGTGAREANGAAREGAAGIATALADISERASLLIHEEIELAKAEVTQKVTRIARGAVVSVAAGVFIVTAVMFALVGCAWLLYFYLPVPTFAYFWGFFAMAVIMLVLGVFAGLIAARVLRSSSPPVPEMAIEEARRIRDTVSNGSDTDRQPPPPWPAAGVPDAGPTPVSTVAPASPPVAPPVAPPHDPPPAAAPPVEPAPAPAAPGAPTIDEAALQADPAADASRVPTDELGPPLGPPDAGDDAHEAS